MIQKGYKSESKVLKTWLGLKLFRISSKEVINGMIINDYESENRKILKPGFVLSSPYFLLQRKREW